MISAKRAPASTERSEAEVSEIEPGSEGRREHTRHQVDLDVSLGSDHNFYSGFAENLSVGGVFVATHLLKPVGEKIEVSIHLTESAKKVRATGIVRWVREYNEASDTPPGMGIRFFDLEPGSAEAIEHFLTTREPLFFDDD